MEASSPPRDQVITTTSATDRYGFEWYSGAKEHVRSLSEKKRKKSARTETLREKKWLQMISKWETIEVHKNAKLKNRVCKGIPDALRSQAWQLLARSRALQATNRELYDKIQRTMKSSQEALILRDLHRTFPSHEHFKTKGGEGQLALFNVLKAYACFDKEVGYCQGMAFIAACLLTYMTEEDSFWMLVSLVQRYGCGGLFLPGMPSIGLYMFQLTNLIERHLPQLHAHFEKEGVMPEMYATKWFITIFSYSFPFETVVRIWDIFLYQRGNWKLIFRTAITVLARAEERLLAMDIEKILDLLKNMPYDIVENESLIKDVMQCKINTNDLSLLEEEYYRLHPDRRSWVKQIEKSK